MEAIRIETVAEEDGEIRLTGLPCKKGETVVLTVEVEDGYSPKGTVGISEEEFWSRLIVPTRLSKEEFQKVLDADHWDE